MRIFFLVLEANCMNNISGNHTLQLSIIIRNGSSLQKYFRMKYFQIQSLGNFQPMISPPWLQHKFSY